MGGVDGHLRGMSAKQLTASWSMPIPATGSGTSAAEVSAPRRPRVGSSRCPIPGWLHLLGPCPLAPDSVLPESFASKVAHRIVATSFADGRVTE
jgi:hypothetical protein